MSRGKSYSIYNSKFVICTMRRELMKKEPKTKILFTLPVELKEELLKEAEKENRSLNNYILTLLLKRNK